MNLIAEKIIKTQKEDVYMVRRESTEVVQNYVIGLSGIDPSSRNYVDSENDIDEAWDQIDVFQWGEWRFNKNRKIVDSDGNPIGYSNVLSAVIAPKGGNSTIQVYKSIPDPIEWELTEINQKNVSFLIGKAKISEINAICSVPALPEELTSEETGERVLNRELAQNEWQRRVNAKRILSISEFIERPANIIANSAILFIPPNKGSVSFSSKEKMKVDFSKILEPISHKNQDWNFSDHDMSKQAPGDLRPLWLIDGQHRTRGLAQSKVGCELEIPIILFTDEFSYGISKGIR